MEDSGTVTFNPDRFQHSPDNQYSEDESEILMKIDKVPYISNVVQRERVEKLLNTTP